MMMGLTSFLAGFSKSRLFCSKDFQRKFWRFCGISRAYKGKKSKVSTSKLFRTGTLLLDTFSAPSGRFPPIRATGRARQRVEAFTSHAGGGRGHRGFIGGASTG